MKENEKLQRRDFVSILGLNKKEYGKAEVQTNWGKAICLRIEGLAKTVWIPKSSFKISAFSRQHTLGRLYRPEKR